MSCKVGAASVDITPHFGAHTIGGYFYERLSEGCH